MNHRFYFLGFFFGFGVGVTLFTCVPMVPISIAAAGSVFCLMFAE